MSSLVERLPNDGSIFIDGPAGKLHVRDLGGTGPIVLAMHGVTGTTYLWDGVAKRLAQDCHLIAFDYRGHGQSDWSREQHYTTEEYAEDLQAVVAWLEDRTKDPLFLMGSSWGALAMLKWLENSPSAKIRALIIVDVEPSFDVSEYAVPPRPYKFSDLNAVEAWEREANPSAPEEELREFARGSVVETVDGDFVRRHDPFFLTRWPFRNDDLWFVLPRLDWPVLVLNGDRSFVREGACREMIERMPVGKYEKIMDSGHLVPLEQPSAVATQVAEFITKATSPLSSGAK